MRITWAGEEGRWENRPSTNDRSLGGESPDARRRVSLNQSARAVNECLFSDIPGRMLS